MRGAPRWRLGGGIKPNYINGVQRILFGSHRLCHTGQEQRHQSAPRPATSRRQFVSGLRTTVQR